MGHEEHLHATGRAPLPLWAYGATEPIYKSESLDKERDGESGPRILARAVRVVRGG